MGIDTKRYDIPVHSIPDLNTPHVFKTSEALFFGPRSDPDERDELEQVALFYAPLQALVAVAFNRYACFYEENATDKNSATMRLLKKGRLRTEVAELSVTRPDGYPKSIVVLQGRRYAEDTQGEQIDDGKKGEIAVSSFGGLAYLDENPKWLHAPSGKEALKLAQIARGIERFSALTARDKRWIGLAEARDAKLWQFIGKLDEIKRETKPTVKRSFKATVSFPCI